MLAAEYILIDISLLSCSPNWTNITELWNMPSAFYLYSATVPGWSNTDYQHSRKPLVRRKEMGDPLVPRYYWQNIESCDLILKIFFILSTIALVLTALGKAILHIYLDSKTGNKIEFARSRGYVYLLPYDHQVSPELEKTKALCNKFQKALIWCTVTFLLLFFLRQTGWLD